MRTTNLFRPGAGPERRRQVEKSSLIASFARLRREAGDAGMSTIEYAIGTLAAAALAGVLLKVVSGQHMMTALTGLIDRALK